MARQTKRELNWGDSRKSGTGLLGIAKNIIRFNHLQTASRQQTRLALKPDYSGSRTSETEALLRRIEMLR